MRDIEYWIAQSRSTELIAEAHRERLALSATQSTSNPSFFSRSTTWIGGRLVSMGLWLQNQKPTGSVQITIPLCCD